MRARGEQRRGVMMGVGYGKRRVYWGSGGTDVILGGGSRRGAVVVAVLGGGGTKWGGAIGCWSRIGGVTVERAG